MSRMKILKWSAAVTATVGLFILIFVFIFVVRATKDLPSIETLAEYKPAVMTRVHAGDGKLITEYAKEARVFVPIATIPKDLQHAFVAAEDQRFYQHSGFDARGFARAMLANVGHVLRNERLEGGSTITQQVAKNFLVGNEREVERKVREIVIARRIEKALSKDQILELYLNEIYFGRRAYGVAAASLNYFAKPMKDLELSQMAYLALLPKGPNNYRLDDPAKKERAFNRRNYVLGRMVEDGYVDAQAAEIAKAQTLEIADRLIGDEYLAAEYFVEEARKQIFSMYGEDELYSGGLSIRTTLDTELQLTGRRALRRGLELYDRRHGYRGPLGRFEDFADWKTRLKAFKAPRDIGDWRVALVMETDETVAQLRLVPPPIDDPVLAQLEEDTDRPFDAGTLDIADVTWAAPILDTGRKGKKPEAITDVVRPGDIILVQEKSPAKSPAKSASSKDESADDDFARAYNLRQVPEVNGGLIAMDPHTGRVLALIGGYSFEQSQFNRATQAFRQPGSAFKPFVYAAALDQGFTPVSQVLDAPFVIERHDIDCRDTTLSEDTDTQDTELQLLPSDADRPEDVDPDSLLDIPLREDCEKYYKPSNFNEGRWYGMSTLRLGLEKSRNAMTVRLANEIGMRPIQTYGQRFGIYDEVRPELAWALGAGETTLLRMAGAYSSLINGGKSVTPTILDRVQDGAGKTIFVHGESTCVACQLEDWDFSPPPELPDTRDAVVDPVTAYQIAYMLKGVVDNGTARVVRSVGRPLGGKTGTTNDFKDGWFMGFSPDLVVGIYVGYDSPRPLSGESGGKVAAPIFRDFMAEALKGRDIVPFRIPENVTLSPVDRETGEPSYIGAPNSILEAFRPGTEPRIGALQATIRIGGGSDTFIGGGFDFGNESKEVTDEQAVETDPGAIDRENDRVRDRDGAEADIQAGLDKNDVTPPQGVGADLEGSTLEPGSVAPQDLAEKLGPDGLPVAVPVQPKPAKDDVEEAFDDGLY